MSVKCGLSHLGNSTDQDVSEQTVEKKYMNLEEEAGENWIMRRSII
jgi:hypothetical protein